MQKTISPGPRPYAVLAMIGAVPLAIGSYIAFSAVDRSVVMILIAVGVVFISASCFLVSRSRVVVSDESITCFAGIARPATAKFEEIHWSIAQTIAELDHPASLLIERDTGERDSDGGIVTEVILRIGLKLYRREDVRWLLSLPQLKVIRT